MDVAAWRSEILSLDRCIYLNTGWSGPSPRRVVRRIQERLAWESEEGPTTPHVLESIRNEDLATRQAVAGFLGAEADEIVLTRNTTEGLNLVLNGLPWQPGDEVITCNLEHPSLLIPCYTLQQRFGAVVRVVALDQAASASDILASIEAALGDRTRMICLSHIAYCTGLVLPMAEIQELAHRRGIPVLVDGAQSAGQMPLDVRALGVDYYAIPGQKWLLGPDGVGALYIRRDLIEALEPTAVSYNAASDFDYAGNLTLNRSSARRFELSTVSAPLYAGLSEAIALLHEIGIDRAAQRISRLAAIVRSKLVALPGVTVLGPQGGLLASGLVNFAVAGQNPDTVTAALWDRAKIVARSVRFPPGTRISVEWFNMEAELDEVVDIVAELVREDASSPAGEEALAATADPTNPRSPT